MTVLNSDRRGQAMILTTLALGGVILGATVIAGTLMLYQIRSTTNAENSAKAIFAADGGTQWVLFDYYCSTPTSSTPEGKCPDVVPGENDYSVSSTPWYNGAAVAVNCYDAGGASSTCSSPSTTSAIAIGNAVDAERALYLTISAPVAP